MKEKVLYTVLFLFFLLALSSVSTRLQAQYVYTINADSVKITNHCDTAELILENHTQNVPGFLFNKGRGRTEFRKALQKLDAFNYLIGGDTLALPSNAWIQGGNTFGTTGILGTLDNNHLDIYTNGYSRARFTANGNLLIGSAADYGYKFQLSGTAGIFMNPNLSRPNDRIRIGGYLNTDDGQNVLFSTSNDGGITYKNILVERDGYIGLGQGGAGWNVGTPTLRIRGDGAVSVASQTFYFGNTGGPYNCSALISSVSNTNEWLDGLGNYPSGQNYYYFGTILQTPEGTNKRAPLKISGRELHWLTGAIDAEAGMIAENGNVLLGTTTDLGYKLSVNGKTGLQSTITDSSASLAVLPSWNTSGTPTGLFLDAADLSSAANSLLVDLQTNNVSQFRVNKTGVVTAHNLSGFGTRMVVADGSGTLSAQPVPAPGLNKDVWQLGTGFGTIAPGSSAAHTMNVTASYTDGTPLLLGVPNNAAAVSGMIKFDAWVSAAGVVTVRATNLSASTSFTIPDAVYTIWFLK